MTAMRAEFRSSTERLASAADEQEAYLRQLGTAPSADELALEFTDALMVEKTHLDEGERTAALHLDEYLSQISGEENAELWTIAALHHAPEWAHVRDLANDLLRRMNAPAEHEP